MGMTRGGQNRGKERGDVIKSRIRSLGGESGEIMKELDAGNCMGAISCSYFYPENVSS